MGMVYSGFLLCYTLAMLPGGWLIDRYGTRAELEMMCLGSAVFVALTGLTGQARTDPVLLWASLMVVRCLMGVVNAPLHPSSAHLVGHSFPPSAVSLANGLVTFAACVGMAATYFLFGELIDHLDWPGAFIVSSELTLGVFLVWIYAVPRPAGQVSNLPSAQRQVGNLPHAKARALLGHRGLVCLTLSYAAVGYFQYLFFYWLQYYFKDVLKLGTDRSRLYTALVVLANGVGMVVGGWLADRVAAGGRALVPVAGLLGSAVALVAGLVTARADLTLVCFIAAMVALGMCEGPCWTTAVVLGGRHGGTAAGLMNTGGNAGGLLSPVLAPQLSVYFGWKVGMGMAAVVAVLGAAFWLGIDPRARLDPPRGRESGDG
jgi:MFS family permease